MSARLQALYRVRCDARSIEARARAIAVEQSVEMPLAAIDDEFVLASIVGRVDEIIERQEGEFEVRIALASETVGDDPGQLLNMLFGNTSLHEDVVLEDVAFPGELAFGRRTTPWPCGLAAAGRRRRAGDDRHGAQAAGPAAAAARDAGGALRAGRHRLHQGRPRARRPGLFAVRRARRGGRRGAHGGRARYVPSLSGDLDVMRRQIAVARTVGIDTVMVAPMIVGLSNFHRLVREHPDLAFLAHPSMAGAARIAPPLLLGKLFRMLLGADALDVSQPWRPLRLLARHLPGAGAQRAQERDGLLPSVPVPAGGMTIDRVGEMLGFYRPRSCC